MSFELVAGIVLSIICMFYALMKSGGELRWGLASGIGAAILIMIMILLLR